MNNQQLFMLFMMINSDEYNRTYHSNRSLKKILKKNRNYNILKKTIDKKSLRHTVNKLSEIRMDPEEYSEKYETWKFLNKKD